MKCRKSWEKKGVPILLEDPNASRSIRWVEPQGDELAVQRGVQQHCPSAEPDGMGSTMAEIPPHARAVYLEKDGTEVGQVMSHRPLTITAPLYRCWATMRLADLEDWTALAWGEDFGHGAPPSTSLSRMAILLHASLDSRLISLGLHPSNAPAGSWVHEKDWNTISPVNSGTSWGATFRMYLE